MRKSRRGKNRHHIFGKARFPQYRNCHWNIVEVNISRHELYHKLFGDKTPKEIIAYLLNTFWNGNTRPLEER